MTVKQLRAFLAVAQTLSFTQACERLHLSQPALSLAIKGLEDTLGGKLLIRNTRNVRLTPEGESLVPQAKQLLAQWDNTEERLRQRFTLQLGRLGVAAMPAFAGNLLPAALVRFRQKYPKINITVHDVINEKVVDMVRLKEVEMGIAFAPEGLGSLHFTPLFDDRFVAVVPRNSQFANADQLTWAELIRQMTELGAHCVPLTHPDISCQVGILTHQELSVAAQALRDVLRDTVQAPSLNTH